MACLPEPSTRMCSVGRSARSGRHSRHSRGHPPAIRWWRRECHGGDVPRSGGFHERLLGTKLTTSSRIEYYVQSILGNFLMLCLGFGFHDLRISCLLLIITDFTITQI